MTSSRIGVTFPGDSGEQVIDRSTEAVWLGAQVLVQVQGSSRWIVGLGGASVPAGISAWFSGTVIPAGWLIEDGTAISRATYWRLYAALGGASSPWGQGDGSTTFNKPNAINRMFVGAGSTYLLGAAGGEAVHALTSDENGPHTHGRRDIHNNATATNPGTYIGSASGAVFYTDNGTGYTADKTGTDSSGLGTPHNNMPPYSAKYPIIKF